MPGITLVFHGDLSNLLCYRRRGQPEVDYALSRRASIKDIIESQGIPHPEVYRLLAQGQEKDFDYLPTAGDRVEVFPFTPPVDVTRPTLIRPLPLSTISFVVDVNVGKLAGLLRMLGFDTSYPRTAGDRRLAELASREGRILLTKDFGLLKRKQVVHGHLVRAIAPVDQALEIVSLYGLEKLGRPFSRCLACNGLLLPVAKEEVLPRLEPLTRRYFNDFRKCAQCARIFWSGSHRDRMEKLVDRLRHDLESQTDLAS